MPPNGHGAIQADIAFGGVSAKVTILNGGEAAYSDPEILYDFILSSYFSVRARFMAEQVEELWVQDPTANKRFRLAGNIGGWTVPARRLLLMR